MAINRDDYARIAAAIEFLVVRRADQPTLDDVAAHVGMSRFHFQRRFKQYAGVTPKQFLAALTLQSAKKLLEGNASVLDASLAVGLSSPARLHDHFVSIDAISPGEYRSGGAGMNLTYGFARSPFGALRAIASDRGLTALDFVNTDGEFDPSNTPLPNATFHRDDGVARNVVNETFGSRSAPVRLHLRGTNFQLRVWNALLTLETGTCVSYADVARAIGMPNAARAVGTAVGSNPVAGLIPCHRVIARSGVVGNYKWGEARKRALLAWEASLMQTVTSAGVDRKYAGADRERSDRVVPER